MYEVFSLGKMPYGANTSNSLAAKQIIAGIIPEKAQYCPANLYVSIIIKVWSKVSLRVFFKTNIVLHFITAN